MVQADRLLRDNRPREAAQVLERALSDKPNAEVSARLGALYAQLGEWPRAVTHLRLAGNPETDPALGSLLALSLAAAGDTDAARAVAPHPDEERPGSELGLLVTTALAHEPGQRLALRKRLWAWRERHGDAAPAELQVAVGALSYALGDSRLARDAYRAAHQARLSDPTWAAGLARVYRQQGQPVPARTLLERLVALHPSHQQAWLQLADVASSDNDARALQNALEHLPKGTSERVGLSVLRARVPYLERRYNAALALLGPAPALGSEALTAEQIEQELLRVRCWMEGGRFDEADARLTQLFARRELSLRAGALRVELELMRGRLELALERAQALAEAQPAEAEARYWLGRVHSARKVWAEALPAYQSYLDRATRKDKRRVEVLRRMGVASIGEGQVPAARALFESALEEDPSALEPLVELVAALPPAEAEARLRRQIKLALVSVPARHLLAERLLKAGQTADAEQVHRDAVADEPDDMRAYTGLAAFLLEAGRAPEALEVLEAAHARDREHLSVLAMLANTCATTGNAKRAAELYEALLKLTPDSVPALNNLAFLYADALGDVESGLRHAERAHALAPDWAEVDDTLGWVQHKRGQHAEALTLLTRAAEKLPRQPSVLYHLGAAQQAAGQTDAARRTLSRALATKGTFPERALTEALLRAN